MKSSEVAKLADVTVRTLRHYHAIGLLPEPPRGANGYREYGADELVRLLRIKRLTALGFSLSNIGDVLDEMDRSLENAPMSSADAALDALDRELELQIERLEEQRRTIALLKREHLAPDLPVQFAQVAKPFIDATYPKSPLSDTNRAALLIAGHLYTENDMAELNRVFKALEEQTLLDQTRTLQERFDQLPVNASHEQIEELIAEGEAWFDPIIDSFDPLNWDDELATPATPLLNEIAHRGLNEAQAYAQDRLMEILEERILARKPESSSTLPSQTA